MQLVACIAHMCVCMYNSIPELAWFFWFRAQNTLHVLCDVIILCYDCVYFLHVFLGNSGKWKAYKVWHCSITKLHIIILLEYNEQPLTPTIIISIIMVIRVCTLSSVHHKIKGNDNWQYCNIIIICFMLAVAVVRTRKFSLHVYVHVCMDACVYYNIMCAVISTAH